MPYVRKLISGSVQTKSGRLYVVLNLYDKDNTRHRRAINTGLTARNGKTAAREFLHNLLVMINEPSALVLSSIMTTIIDECNKRCKGDFSQQRYLGALREIINENSRLSTVYSDMLFTDYLKRWLKSKRNLQPLTYEGYSKMIAGRISEFFDSKGYTVNSLTPDAFEEYYDFLIADCGLTECTALHHHRMMKQALSYGVKKEILSFNVLDKVEAPQDSSFKGDYYRPHEAKTLIEKAKDDALYTVILLTVYYGLRRSEVLGLRWSAIDFETNTIRIERKLVSLSKSAKRYDSDKMKTDASVRTLPLIPVVKDALLYEQERQKENKKQFQRAYFPNNEGYICINSLGHLLTPEFVTGHFNRLLKLHNLRRIRFHDLRHTCATLLATNGIPLLQISRWLGHSNIGITEKYYLHSDISLHITTAKKMEEILEG